MIVVQDNFLPSNIFDQIHGIVTNAEFQKIKFGDKEFLTIPTPEELLPLMQIDGCDLHFSFIRKAYNEFDTDARIHADNIIMGRKIKYASVLYLNKDEDNVTPNGTAFYKHQEYGFKLSEENEKFFDDIIVNDANDPNKWSRFDMIYSKPNRLLTYDADLFHAKFPHLISKGERIVLVNFYAEKEVEEQKEK